MDPFEVLGVVPRAGGGACRFLIPERSGYFEGHFPGRPLVPGVAHFGLVLASIGRLVGADVRFVAVDHVRFRKPLGPGDTVEVDVEGPGPEGAVRFALRSGGDRVSQGDGRVAPGAPDAPPGGADESHPAARGAESLLPHRIPARLVEGVLDADERRCVCSARIPAGSAFLAAGAVPAFVGFEMAAQTAAVLEALGRAGSGSDAAPRAGYLVAVRDARLRVALLRADRPLLAAVEQTESAFPLSFYRMTVSGGGRTLVEGTIGTYIDSAEG